MKQPRLIDNYSIHEINVAMSRILSMTEQVVRDHPYNVEQISARLTLDENLVKSILNVFVEQGLWKYSSKTDFYFVPGDLR